MHRRTFPQGALGVDSPTMSFDNTSTNEKSEAKTGELPIVHIRAPMEALKNARKLLGGNSNAVIADGKMGLVVLSPDLDSDVTAVRAVLDRVFEEVFENLLDPLLIENSNDRALGLDNNLLRVGARAAR